MDHSPCPGQSGLEPYFLQVLWKLLQLVDGESDVSRSQGRSRRDRRSNLEDLDWHSAQLSHHPGILHLSIVSQYRAIGILSSLNPWVDCK